MSKELYLYNIVNETKVLGAGNRFAIWVQGCDKLCPQCIAPDTRSKTNGGYYLAVEELANLVLTTDNITGITITGGEPFLQSIALCEFIQLLNIHTQKLNYIIYTGFRYDELQQQTEYKKLLGLIDLLIDGEYINELNHDTPLIGSSNQGVYVLSEVGRKLAVDMISQQNRKIEVIVKNKDEVFMVGIPPKGQLTELNKL